MALLLHRRTIRIIRIITYHFVFYPIKKVFNEKPKLYPLFILLYKYIVLDILVFLDSFC